MKAENTKEYPKCKPVRIADYDYSTPGGIFHYGLHRKQRENLLV